MTKKEFENLKLPETPGVYLFKKGRDLLYVGKATSLRSRVRSYFSDDLIKTRGRLLVDMITQADNIDYQETDSVLEAIILEAKLIKENQPKYNTKDKDNKSYNYVAITDEDFPRVLVVRGRNLEQNGSSQKVENSKAGVTKYKYIFGPYPYGGELKEALKLVRKIFPFRDKCIPFVEISTITDGSKINKKTALTLSFAAARPRPCFNRTIGLCPGVCTGEITKKEYAVQIKNIKMFFEGHKIDLLKNLEKEMHTYAKEKEFEKAGEIKKTIFALNHIQDVSLMKDSAINKISHEASIRIEAYDIAHMSGKDMVGAMVVLIDGEFDKSSYRKFTIKGFDNANDAGALEEVVKRRIAHAEWPKPDIVVLDGNQIQLKRAYETWNTGAEPRGADTELRVSNGTNVLFCSVVKDKNHKADKILFANNLKWEDFENRLNISKKILKEQIIKINAEVHRFVIAFHKNKRAKSFLK